MLALFAGLVKCCALFYSFADLNCIWIRFALWHVDTNPSGETVSMQAFLGLGEMAENMIMIIFPYWPIPVFILIRYHIKLTVKRVSKIARWSIWVTENLLR